MIGKEEVEVYWDYGGFRIIVTKVKNILVAYEDVVVVSLDT